MRQFFTKIFLTIAAFSLFIGVASVAYGAEEPAAVSGVCDITNSHTNAPTFYLPDVGVGYAKKANPGVNTISELRQVCTKEVYQELLRQYCAQNSERVQRGVITYNTEGKIVSTGGSAYGSDYIYCDSLGADLSKITGVCELRDNNTNAPGFFDPDIGPGYIKKAQPGVNSIGGLREVCTREVYKELLVDYCKQNTEPASPEVITYGEGGGYESAGGSAFGNEPMNCQAEESPPDEEVSAVNFPIPELGNCGSEGECHDYCEDLEHASACIAYAKANNLLTEEDEKNLDEFSDVIENGGPGGCKTEESCGAYCEDTANLKECLEFVKKHNLLNDDEIKEVEKAVEIIENGGPGGCTKEEECRIYCEDIDNIEECVNFVEKFDLVTPDELKEMRKMADVKKAGVSFPGNCKTKESCLAYCDNSARQVECMEFALEAGFIPEEDSEAVSKIIPYLKSGGKLPGGCTTKESCDAYCESDANTNECVDFAVKAGFIPKEDADIIRKTGGKGPGNCKSKEACENYCEDEAHIDECVDFAVKAGFISQEEADNAKKYRITSGPGGCKSKAECEAFCITNQDVCFEFAKEHGMISEEDLKNIEQQKDFLKSLDTAPPEWLACMEKELGSEFFERFKAHKFTQAEANSPAMQAAQRKCGGEIGQDIRKEIEVCLGKATCDEFNSCFDALPKGNNQDNGQSSGQGQQQEPQDENGKKIEARARACLDEKMDACIELSCSEFESCLKSLQQGGGEQSGQQGAGDQGGQQGQGSENTKFNAKMKVCQDEIKEIKMKEVQEKMDACLTLSCSEFDACIKSVQGGGEQGTGDQGGQQEQGQGTPDPKVEAKAKACQQEQVNACLSKPCSEFQACLNALGGDGDGEQQGGGTPDPAVQSKFMTCFPPPPQNQGDGGGPQSLLMENPYLGAILRFLFR